MYKLIVKDKESRESLKSLCKLNPEVARKPLIQAMTLISFIADQGKKLKRMEFSRRLLGYLGADLGADR